MDWMWMDVVQSWNYPGNWVNMVWTWTWTRPDKRFKSIISHSLFVKPLIIIQLDFMEVSSPLDLYNLVYIFFAQKYRQWKLQALLKLQWDRSWEMSFLFPDFHSLTSHSGASKAGCFLCGLTQRFNRDLAAFRSLTCRLGKCESFCMLVSKKYI